MDPKPAPSPPQPPRPRVVVSRVNRRDILIGVFIGVIGLSFIFFAVFSTGEYKEHNKLTGVVSAHNPPAARETLMTVSRRGVTEKTADTGYSLKVWVESEKREYEVMVSKEDWDKTKDGEKLSFMRPKSEQR
jgi:hypothetical protein